MSHLGVYKVVPQNMLSQISNSIQATSPNVTRFQSETFSDGGTGGDRQCVGNLQNDARTNDTVHHRVGSTRNDS
jgi:hypothetical protein